MALNPNRVSVSTQPMDQRMLEHLAQITGQSISAVASRAFSEWLLEHYEERKEFYTKNCNEHHTERQQGMACWEQSSDAPAGDSDQMGGL